MTKYRHTLYVTLFVATDRINAIFKRGTTLEGTPFPGEHTVGGTPFLVGHAIGGTHSLENMPRNNFYTWGYNKNKGWEALIIIKSITDIPFGDENDDKPGSSLSLPRSLYIRYKPCNWIGTDLLPLHLLIL